MTRGQQLLATPLVVLMLTVAWPVGAEAKGVCEGSEVECAVAAAAAGLVGWLLFGGNDDKESEARTPTFEERQYERKRQECAEQWAPGTTGWEWCMK